MSEGKQTQEQVQKQEQKQILNPDQSKTQAQKQILNPDQSRTQAQKQILNPDQSKTQEQKQILNPDQRQLQTQKQIQKENVVLCGANSYEQKYYFNQDFAKLPEGIKQELQIMCVLFTEDVGGILTMEFTPEGELEFKVQVDDNDYLFDEIGSGLKIKQYQMEKRDFLEGLELFYKVFFLGADPAAFLEEEEKENSSCEDVEEFEDSPEKAEDFPL